MTGIGAVKDILILQGNRFVQTFGTSPWHNFTFYIRCQGCPNSLRSFSSR